MSEKFVYDGVEFEEVEFEKVKGGGKIRRNVEREMKELGSWWRVNGRNGKEFRRVMDGKERFMNVREYYKLGWRILCEREGDKEKRELMEEYVIKFSSDGRKVNGKEIYIKNMGIGFKLKGE